MKRLILTLILLVTASCSAVQHPRFPELSPEGKVAVIGRQFVAATSEAATTIDTLITSGVLTKEQGVSVLTRLKPIGSEAQRLAAVLVLIDDARTDADRNAGLAQAVSLIRTLQRHVGSAAIPISTETGRERVTTILGGLADLLLSISLVLPGHQEALAS